MTAARAPNTAAPDLLEVVVARGRSVVDATGEQILAGRTAKVAVAEIPRLVEAGYVVDPNDQPAQRDAQQMGEAGRLAWGLHVTARNALTVAVQLRPAASGGALRAQQIGRLADEMRDGAARLLALLASNEGGTP